MKWLNVSWLFFLLIIFPVLSLDLSIRPFIFYPKGLSDSQRAILNIGFSLQNISLSHTLNFLQTIFPIPTLMCLRVFTSRIKFPSYSPSFPSFFLLWVLCLLSLHFYSSLNTFNGPDSWVWWVDEVISSKKFSERNVMWHQCVEASWYTMEKVDGEFVARKVYNVIFDMAYNESNTNLVSSSSTSVGILMVVLNGSFNEEVWGYHSFFLDDTWVENFHDGLEFSNTSNGANIILERFFPSDSICMWRPPDVRNNYFYFYPDIIEDSGVGILFTIFKFELLRILNVTPFQLHHNIWAFNNAFEVVCWGFNVTPTTGIFFSFF